MDTNNVSVWPWGTDPFPVPDTNTYPGASTFTITNVIGTDPGIEVTAVCACCGKREPAPQEKLPEQWMVLRRAGVFFTGYALCSYSCVEKFAKRSNKVTK